MDKSTKGGYAKLKKYGTAGYSSMGKKSVAKRLGNMTNEEKKDYFNKVRQGISPKDPQTAPLTND